MHVGKGQRFYPGSFLGLDQFRYALEPRIIGQVEFIKPVYYLLAFFSRAFQRLQVFGQCPSGQFSGIFRGPYFPDVRFKGDNICFDRGAYKPYLIFGCAYKRPFGAVKLLLVENFLGLPESAYLLFPDYEM